MKKLIVYAMIAGLVIFAASQFVRPTFSNPEVIPGQPIEDAGTVPPELQMILSRSCNDCHSNKTLYPWYSHITPANWFMADHIDHGRSHLNMSEWGGYTNDQKVRKLEEICEEVSAGNMPLPSYLLLHREAALTQDQKDLICRWTRDEGKRLSNPPPS
ncbi:MAG: heme-binding domain-containing protein [Chloracidobacterium sp.]|nr:heme-binding domain-containing protein [Chloracidobacterium sp.]